MLPFVVGFQICRICIHHLEATLVTPAACPLLSPLGEFEAGELLVDAGGVGLLPGGGLLDVRVSRSLVGAGGGTRG